MSLPLQLIIGETANESGFTEAAHERTQKDADRTANVVDAAQVCRTHEHMGTGSDILAKQQLSHLLHAGCMDPFMEF